MADDSGAEPAAESTRPLVEVADGVHVATAVIWTTTSTVVVDGGRALVVDPAVTPAEVDALATTVRAHGWRVGAGFSTHPHWDHVLWARSLGDVPRWATDRAVGVLEHDPDAARRSAQEIAPGHDLALLGRLDALGADDRELPWPTGVRVVAHDAHAPGHAALVVRGVLVAGDMLSDVEVPLLDVASPDPLGTYRAALDMLEDTARAVDVLVPGHGTPAAGRAALAARFAADRAYLDALEHAASGPGTRVVAVTDPRLSGYVATWHDEQLAALSAR
ncbi:MBL fold metallo-hydrolase [Cellulosimicrobium terreum]|nr:MBL fold metallo-hydrolase [Cellulosimicrobium terreum]